MRLRLDGIIPDVQLQLADVGNATDAHAAGAATITKEPWCCLRSRHGARFKFDHHHHHYHHAAAAAAADNLLVIW